MAAVRRSAEVDLEEDVEEDFRAYLAYLASLGDSHSDVSSQDEHKTII